MKSVSCHDAAVRIAKAIEHISRTSNRLRGQRYSKRMKRYPTETEAMLADALKRRRYWFIQQSTMFDEQRLYIADFVLRTPRGKLVIEVDGPGHLYKQQYDSRRDKWMVQHRVFQVLRFTSKEVFSDLPRVISVIDQYSPNYN